MAEDLQYLMERIQKDAVDKAENEALICLFAFLPADTLEAQKGSHIKPLTAASPTVNINVLSVLFSR